jgi:multiple sugar transport system ATP-binding protein
VVLVGPSGCGKSTLLRMVAGLEGISGGTLRIGERVVNDLPPRDRDIAMVFQSYALYPHMSVYENLAFGLRLRGTDRAAADAQVRAAAAMLGIEELLERKPRQLSGGQRQRVALGRALVRQPQVFLLDEPLSNLDAKLRMVMRSEIARLHRRLGATMLYVTHDQIDTPMRLYDDPDNLFVAGFLGSPAMNVFRGTLASEGNALVLDGAARLPLPATLPASVAALPHDQHIAVGLRPEDLHVQALGGDTLQVEARLESIEPVGNEIFLGLDIGGSAATSRVAPQSLPEVGATLRLHYRPDRLRFFAAHSGQRLR